MRHQAETNLLALIESTADFIWSVDLDFCLLAFNRALQRDCAINFGTEATVGKRPEELFPPEIAAGLPALYRRALAEGAFRTEYPYVNGRILELSLNPIEIAGAATAVSVLARDVTEHKAAEKALTEAEKKYRSIFDGALEGMFQTTLDGRSVAANPALARMLGYDSPQDVLWKVRDVGSDVWVDSRERAEFIRQLDEFGFILGHECRFKRKDGTAIWVSLNCHRAFSVDGKTPINEGFIVDITERKRNEDALRESAKFLEEAQRIGGFGWYSLEIASGEWTNSEVIDEIFGIGKDYERNRTGWESLVHPEDRAAMGVYFEEEVLGKGTEFDREYRIQRHSDQAERWVHGMGQLELDAAGRPFRMRGAIKDITERKRAEIQLRHSEERYRTAFQTSLDAVNINRIDDGAYVDVNQAFLDITGYAREEVMGRSSLELGIWADPRDRLRLLEALRARQVCPNLEAQFRRKNGTLLWGLMSASVIELGGVQCVLTVTRDISEAKAAEERLAKTREALRTSEKRYRTVFQTSLDCISISRLDNGLYIDVNRAFLDLMGAEQEEIIGRTSVELNLWVEPKERENFIEALHHHSSLRDTKTRFRKRDGEIVWVLISASIIEIEGSACILSVMRDISEAKAAEDKIWSLAFYDSLTGLPNRRLLMDRLRQTLAHGARTSRKKALLFVDLDNFKTLNDTQGHQTGDLLLQEVARRIAGSVREPDSVARLGGDEFVVMLEDLSEIPEDAAAQAGAVGEKILAAVDRPYWLDGRECLSTSSIGITVFGDKRESTTEVLQQADIAMYQAKAAGRNTVRFFAPALQAAVRARAAMEVELRQAIKARQFVLYYQPQVDCNGLIGAEALIRWQHPVRGLLAPDEFITLAEETGLILPLGEWVLLEACKQIAAWARRKAAFRFAVAVNISARQFREPDFVNQVLQALECTGANPANLRLELTESMLVDNIEDVITKMTEFKSLGLGFSLDDFGTGYSSLAYLKRLPLNQLKIDRSFVRDILDDVGSRAIAQSVISLGRALGLTVIAEGVESSEQREYLISLGCNSFQGYLYSRPLPAEDFERLWLDPAVCAVPVLL